MEEKPRGKVLKQFSLVKWDHVTLVRDFHTLIELMNKWQNASTGPVVIRCLCVSDLCSLHNKETVNFVPDLRTENIWFKFGFVTFLGMEQKEVDCSLLRFTLSSKSNATKWRMCSTP